MTDLLEYLQKPSLKSKVDISHILSKEFGAIYSTDCVEPEIIENLKITQGSTDENHQKFVADLIEITTEREKLFEQTKLFHQHLKSALDKAEEDDMRAEEERKDFAYLNLPRDESTFFKYIDDDLLRENGLIAPSDVLFHLNIPQTEDMPSDATFINTDVSSTRSLLNNNDKPLKLPPISKEKSLELKPRTKSSKKNKKESSLLATEKDADAFLLNQMNARNNFLKNPRYHTDDLDQQQKIAMLIQPQFRVLQTSPLQQDVTKFFQAIPERIEFTDYETGKVYEKLINFRNITSVLQNIRVLPPKTCYFSLGLGQFPGEYGCIAAGISCQYSIRFSPDSLGDYQDQLTIETNCGNNKPYLVDIRCERPRPILTGSTNWNMGYCLIYGVKIVHYQLKNIGGNGKFWIVNAENWPTSNCKNVQANNQVLLEPFIIRPSYFEIKRNETVFIEVLFCPTNLDRVSREFMVLCDNCHLEKFTIEGIGEMASVSLKSIEDGFANAEIEESKDISAEMLIRFDPINPFTYCQKTLIVKNESHSEIPFCWKIVKPHLKINFDNEPITRSESDALQSRTLDLDSAFHVEPGTGVFQPKQSISFSIVFAPLEVREYHSVLHLVLQGLPDILDQGLDEKSKLISGISVGDKSESSKQFDEPIVSTAKSSSSNQISASGSSSKIISLIDLTCMELEIKSKSIPLQVKLSSPSIIIAGSLLVNTLVRKQLEIINESLCPVNINWQNTDSDSHIFEVEPKFGIVEANSIGKVDVCIVAKQPGFIRDSCWCHVDNLDGPLQLIVEAKFHGAQLEIDPDFNNLDFGLLKVGQTKTMSVVIANNSATHYEWWSRIASSIDIELQHEISISPSKGILQSLQRQQVQVTLTPATTKQIRCELEFSVKNASSRSVSIQASIQNPVVIPSKCQIEVDNLQYVLVPYTYQVTLSNLSFLDTEYSWNKPIGENLDKVVVTYYPSHGAIKAKENINVEITVVCLNEILLENLFLTCSVTDMLSAISVELKGLCKGPSIQCHIIPMSASLSDDSQSDLLDRLNFGDDIAVFKTVTRTLILENQTSIVTDFNLSVMNFPAATEAIEANIKGKPNLADRLSKPENLAHYDFCKSMLQSKKGFAVGFDPPRGTLQAYEKVTIKITAYNDMWGKYWDILTISGTTETTTVQPVIIPIQACVEGIPIEFTMNAGRLDNFPALRLGSKPIGHPLITRRVRLNNKSPCDIYINWEMYEDESTELSQDEQLNGKLIDLIVNIGNPFPLPSEANLIANNDSDSTNRTDRPIDIFDYSSTTASTSAYSTSRPQLPQDVSNRTQDDNSITNNQWTSDRPFITVFPRPHRGQLTNKPLTFKPNQLLLGSESYGFVDVIYNPAYLGNLSPDQIRQLNWDNNDSIDFKHYLLGFLSLNSKDLRNHKHFSYERKQQYETDQLKLDITSRLLKPSLNVDYPQSDDKDEIGFALAYSTLYLDAESNKITKDSIMVKGVAVLTNNKDCDLQFTLNTHPPFSLVNTKLANGIINIGIGQSIDIDVKFTVDRHMIDLLSDQSLYNTTDDCCGKRIIESVVDNISGKTSKQLQFRDVISVKYDNCEIDQLLPLRGTIYFPEFSVNRQSINFGVCLVREKLCETVRVVNRSNASCSVNLQLECTEQDIFKLNGSQFTIPNQEFVTEGNQLTLLVEFNPLQACEYNARIHITGFMGETTSIIDLFGIGSYDNQYLPE